MLPEQSTGALLTEPTGLERQAASWTLKERPSHRVIKLIIEITVVLVFVIFFQNKYNGNGSTRSKDNNVDVDNTNPCPLAKPERFLLSHGPSRIRPSEADCLKREGAGKHEAQTLAGFRV